MKELFYKVKEKWMAFANILMKINTRIILFIVYFFVLGPISVMMRIFGSDLLEKKIDHSQETFFKPREKNLTELERYKRQF